MPTPIPSPSAICLVNGQPLSTVNTSGINVNQLSTITVDLANIAGVTSWSIFASQADDLTQANGNLIAVNNSKTVNGFQATFHMPDLVLEDYFTPEPPGLNPVGRGFALQFTSIVNEGMANEDRFTFGVFCPNGNNTRLFFGGETNESNATVGNAADLNRLVTFGFIPGVDLAGNGYAQEVVNINGIHVPPGTLWGGPFWPNKAVLTLDGTVSPGLQKAEWEYITDTSVDANAQIAATKLGGSPIGSGEMDFIAYDGTEGAPAHASYKHLTGDVQFPIGGVTQLIAIRGKATDPALASISSPQDGYVLTWDNPHGWWTIKPQTGGGPGGVTWSQDLAGSNNLAQIVTSITGAGGLVNLGPGETLLTFKGQDNTVNGLISIIGGAGSYNLTGGGPQDILLQGGDTSYNPTHGTRAGNVTLMGGSGFTDGISDTNVDGGDIYLTGGAAENATVDHSGGSVYLTAGRATSGSTDNGAIYFRHSQVKPSTSLDILAKFHPHTVTIDPQAIDSTSSTYISSGTGGTELFSGDTILLSGSTVKALAVTQNVILDGYTDVTVKVAGNTIGKFQKAVNADGSFIFDPALTSVSIIHRDAGAVNTHAADFWIQPQSGQGASGTGGDLYLTSGASTFAAANAGNIYLKTDGKDGYVQMQLTPTGSTINTALTLSFLGTGVVHSDSSGILTSSLIVNTDVSATAAIAGTKITPAFGSQNISTTGTLSAGATTVTSIQDTGLGTGVVHSDGSGNFSSSTIVNADVSSSAAIAVSKLAAGTAGQLLLNNSTPTPTWTTVSGDVTISSAGATTVGKINGTTVTTAGGSLTTGQVLRVTGASSSDWGAVDLANSNAVTGVLPFSNIGTITLTGDVTGSSGTGSISTTVTAISGTSPISITPAELKWTAGTVSPKIDQANASSGSGNDLTIKAQTTTASGQSGGSVVLSGGAGGSGGANGSVILQNAGVNNVFFNQGQAIWADVGPITINQGPKAGTGANNGVSFTIQAQQGQAQTGVTNNNNGGNLVLASGIAGTGGSGTAGTGGNLLLQTNGTTRLTLSDSNITVAAFGTAGIVHNDSSGNLSSSLIVNADVDSSAAIAYSKLNLTGDIVDSDIGSSANIAVSKLAAGTNTYILSTVSGVPTWIAPPSGSGVTWSNDLSGSSDTHQYVASISGSAGGGGTVPLNITTLQFGSSQSAPLFNQADQTSPSTNGQALTIQSQNATGSSSNGGNLFLKAGTGTGSGGLIVFFTGGTNRAQFDGSGTFRINAFTSAGVVHNNSSGDFSTSLIVNADVDPSAAIAYSKLNLSGSIVNADISSSAAIAYSKLSLTGHIVDADVSSSAAIAVDKLAAGTAGQLLLNNSTPVPTWTTITGDVSLTSAGATTVIAIQNNNVQSGVLGAGQDQYVLTWNNATSDWRALPASGSGVTWANDLAGSTNTNQYVAAISGNAGGGGSIPINATTLAFASGQSTPAVNQTALSSTSSGSGSDGQSLSLVSQAGQAATGASHNGGNGGSLILSSGAGGTSGSATPGASGNVQLQIGGTTNLTFTTGTAQWGDVGNININQAQKPGTGANAGAAFTITSQNGQNQSGVNANNNGGDIHINTGSPGTGGSGAAGVAGTIFLQNGGGTKITISPTTITFNSLNSAGVVHTNSSGDLSTSTIVNADVSSSAAIAVSKLAAGSAGQILINNATPAPTWTSISGDITLGNTGGVTVVAVQGNAYKAETPGSAQDGYVPTWVNANNRFEIKPQTGSGGGSGVTTVGTIDSQTKSANGAVISGTSIYMQTADASNVGLMSTGTQTIAGAKTFSGTFTTSSTTNLGSSTTKNTYSGGQIVETFTCSSTLTLGDGYFQVFVDTSAARSITLPAPANGRQFWITDTIGSAETNNITLVRNGTEKINGVAASKVLQTNWGSWRVVSNGTDWFVG